MHVRTPSTLWRRAWTAAERVTRPRFQTRSVSETRSNVPASVDDGWVWWAIPSFCCCCCWCWWWWWCPGRSGQLAGGTVVSRPSPAATPPPPPTSASWRSPAPRRRWSDIALELCHTQRHSNKLYLTKRLVYECQSSFSESVLNDCISLSDTTLLWTAPTSKRSNQSVPKFRDDGALFFSYLAQFGRTPSEESAPPLKKLLNRQ